MEQVMDTQIPKESKQPGAIVSAGMRAEPIRIREAKFSDVEDMVILLKHLFALEPDFVFNPEKQRKGLIRLMCQEEGRCLLVAEAGGKVVGMCSAQTLISTAEGSKAGLVEDVVVLPEYRGQGIGFRLLQTLEQWARTNGLTRLQLLLDQGNAAARKFYAKQGWGPTRMEAMRKRVE